MTLLRRRLGDRPAFLTGVAEGPADLGDHLAARGAEPAQAAAWGVYLHGAAGARLSVRVGQMGFLARELLAEVPPLMAQLS